METNNSQAQELSAESSSAYGVIVSPMASAAALDPSAFGSLSATSAIPTSWEDRAKKAWEYYVEEPLVKNCINSWRTFAVGDEIKIASDDDAVKEGANTCNAQI